MELASYKLMFSTRRVRIVPRLLDDGAPFSGPGVDVLGESADEVLAAAAPVARWLEEREPGVRVRSISVDRGRGRVLITLESSPKPRVLRLDGGAATELLDEARALEALLVARVRPLLAEREARAR